MNINWWIVGLTVLIGICIVILFMWYRLAKTVVPPVTTNIDNISDRLETGDLVVVNYNSKHGKIIRIATETVWSHIGLVIVIDEKPYIIEVADYNKDYKGLSLIPLDDWKDINSGRYCGYLPTDSYIDTQELYDLLKPYYGIELDMDLLNWAHTLGWKDNRYEEKTEYFCSEFIALILQKLGKLSCDKDPSCYSPQKILDIKGQVNLDVFYLE